MLTCFADICSKSFEIFSIHFIAFYLPSFILENLDKKYILYKITDQIVLAILSVIWNSSLRISESF